MIWRTIYFKVFIVIVFLVSCTNRETKTTEDTPEKSDRQTSTRETVKIVQLLPLTIDLKKDLQLSTAYYQNTTLYTNMVFGDLLNVQFTDLQNQEIKLPQNVEDVSIQQRKTKTLRVKKTRWQLNLIFDNDIFDNRDYYYTNGLKIELIAPFIDASPIKHMLIGSKHAEIDRSGLSLNQNIYTPTNPDTSIILIGDRPFAGVLALGQFRETYNFNKLIYIKSQITIGVIGPLSFSKNVQTSIHEMEPVGWPNQIQNDLIIDYSLEIQKGLISNPNIEINAKGAASIGTLYNKAGAGLNLRFGNFMPVYRGPFSYFENTNPGGRYQFWFFAEGMVDIVAYDATLQGGLFTDDNPYVIPTANLNRFVFRGSLGFALYYNNIGLEYEHFYLTPEFKGAYHFGWGRLKAVLAF